MTDKNDFDFNEESEIGTDMDEGGFDFDEPLPEDTEVMAKKKSSTPMLVLLLLLVAIGAGAYYYFFMLPASAPPVTAKVVKKQPIAVPARPAEPKAKPDKAVTEKPEASEKQSAAPVADESKVAAADAGKVEAAGKTAKPVPAKEAPVPQVAPVEPLEKPAAPVAKTAEVTPEKSEKASPHSAAVTPVVTSASDARYTIQAGAYTRNSSLERAKKMVQDLGYEPQVKAVQRQVDVIRLRLGAFYPAEGRQKLQEILPLAPDAFAVQKGELMVIYAASFQDKKLAERFTASLKEKGLHVDEERSPVDLKMMLISFGEFSDKAKAQEAAKAAQKAGLETMITPIAR
ncbi:SPOR domain-containing protein [Desulfuromonas sp. AOP6]|uniref:SPOR domain-containing protein n=1 Tax=Desulfuromonas sp. AOP6 TaxID=1566351 RepID=UPI0012854818|nr:SPOR domain-containing protein [Desulfuromonas sp. AOP6]BCA79241.1 hypothetical protein AOP6_1028 [Desulfuromonas sp. AOP6]